MKVLVVKTTSMGDVIHTLPALTDAGTHIPDIRFDWVVEHTFSEIPALHPLVDRIIPVRMRQWRHHWLRSLRSESWKQFKKAIQAQRYDLVLDAQGLMKSALLAKLAGGPRAGLDWQSAREPLASLVYQKKYAIAKNQHAILRVRQLFAQALSYSIDPLQINYGLSQIECTLSAPHYVVFLHGTTWVTKHWPKAYWCDLAQRLVAQGFTIRIPYGNAQEQARALEIQTVAPAAIEVLPKMGLTELAGILQAALAVVAVDTGLGHLAAALDVPTISLYGPTDPKKIGTQGQGQRHLKTEFVCLKGCRRQSCAVVKAGVSGCFDALTPDWVMLSLQPILARKASGSSS